MKARISLLLLVLAACGGGEATITTSSGISLTTEAADTTTASDVAGSEATTSSSTTTTITVADDRPALGVGVTASDSFEEDHLVANRGSSFVPMDDPVMVPAGQATWLNDDTVIMGVTHESGEAHAYPVGQMAYHHIANTTIAGEPFLVTY